MLFINNNMLYLLLLFKNIDLIKNILIFNST
jgi:hypothetical protein